MKNNGLNYRPIIALTPPKGKVAVSAHHIEELDKVIQKKIQQSEAEYAAGVEVASMYTVR